MSRLNLAFVLLGCVLTGHTYASSNEHLNLVKTHCPHLLSSDNKVSSMDIRDLFKTCENILVGRKSLLKVSNEIADLEKKISTTRSEHAADTGDKRVENTNILYNSNIMFLLGSGGFENNRIAEVFFKGQRQRVKKGVSVGGYVIEEIEETYITIVKGNNKERLHPVTVDEIKIVLGINKNEEKPKQGIPVMTPSGLGKIF